MQSDPVIDELHRIKDEIAKEFNYDVHALFESIRQEEKKSGRTYVSFENQELPMRPTEEAERKVNENSDNSMSGNSRRDVVEIDLSSVTTSEGLHRLLPEVLEFPEFYGRNWDAFWDAITGLVEMPRRLVFRGWSALTSRLPIDARQMRSCLDDMTEQYPEWAAAVEYD